MSLAVETVKNHYFQALKSKLQHETAKMGVVGLGYVGLPNAVAKAKGGYRVTGFEVDAAKAEQINRGTSYISDVPSRELSDAVRQGRLTATTDFRELDDIDVVFISVPTPVDAYKQPDLSYVERAAESVAAHISSGTLVILESTTYPETTEEIVVPALRAKDFTVGEDVFVAYSPERIDPGNKQFNVENTPRIVGGMTLQCTELACLAIGTHTFAVSSPKVAELAKIHENTFRYVNIALANELTLICEKMGIDVWEVIDAAATKPYGFTPFYPSAGVGGHCIPIDPYYLTYKSRRYGVRTRLSELAGEINDYMPEYALRRIVELLNRQGKAVAGSRIALMGAAYKRDIADTRESSVYRIYSGLKKMDADLAIFDPYVSEIVVGGERIDVAPPDYERINTADLVVILTDHTQVAYDQIAQIILDTRNTLPGSEQVYKL